MSHAHQPKPSEKTRNISNFNSKMRRYRTHSLLIYQLWKLLLSLEIEFQNINMRKDVEEGRACPPPWLSGCPWCPPCRVSAPPPGSWCSRRRSPRGPSYSGTPHTWSAGPSSTELSASYAVARMFVLLYIERFYFCT